MPPTAPAAPVTRIGLAGLCFVVVSLTLDYFQKTNWRRGARAGLQCLFSPAELTLLFEHEPSPSSFRITIQRG
jgi:hypothetical protein